MPNRRLTSLAVGAILLSSCGSSDDAVPATAAPVTDAAPATDPPATDPPPTEAPATDPPPTDPPPTDPPATDPPPTDPAVPDIEFGDGTGPYEVGVQTITITDATGGDRDLTVDVWFPLRQDLDAQLPPQQYTLLPGVYYESPSAVAATADSIATDGPFPLVVYSHGSGGLRYIHSNYTEAIASHGYVVAAPDHTGNTAVERIAGSGDPSEVIAFNRPNDVVAVINAMLDPESTETVGFVAAVDPERIAVTGHSFGGFTAYAVVTGFDNAVGVFEADTRVDAIIPLAPATNGLSDERLASIGVPSLVIAGTDDVTTPIEPNVTRPWETSTFSPAYRVDLVAAEHQTFTDVCAYLDFLPTLPEVPDVVTATIEESADEGCLPDDMPIERAQSITNTFVAAFLDSVFRGTDPIDPLTVDEQDDLVYLVR